MNKHKASYVKWIALLILLYAIIIAVGIWASHRDAQREAERKYEFNIIQSIIENLALYQDEIESWGYQVSVLTLEEEPENEVFLRYHWNHCSHPVLILTDADGGIYCFYYGFDGYTSTVSYPAEVEHTDAIKTVSLELFKRELYQAPYWENPYDADKGSHYDIKVAIEVTVFSIEENEEIWAWSEIGRAHTNYCSNNFVDCKYFNGIDPDGANRSCDYRIKREYSAEQLLAFYRQGLDLQERLIELYQNCLYNNYDLDYHGEPSGIYDIFQQQPIDDTHDAFLVSTGGKLGTLLVTAELAKDKSSDITFSIWNPVEMEQPIQTFSENFNMGVAPEFHHVVDADFDGFQDFGYLYDAGNHFNYWHYWLWDEELEQFKYCGPLEEISQPGFDTEQQVVTSWLSSGAKSGTRCLYRWIDGELTLVRIIKFDCFEPDTQSITIEDWLDGKMAAEYRREYKFDSEEYYAISQWFDLDYHGEPTEED